MIAIIILIAVASNFSRTAESKNLNRYLWGAIGFFSYYIGQIIFGILIAAVNPSLMSDTVSINLIGIVVGICSVGVAHIILQKMKDPKENNAINNNLLDSDFR
jgi:uncharacterized membrane protein YuzA (DUF378 family)